MTTTIDIKLKPLSAQAFRPFGEIIGVSDAPAVAMGSSLEMWPMNFDVVGDTELMFGRYGYKPMRLDKLERHFNITQSFLPLGGGASVMVVSAPTDPENPDAVPGREDLRAFYLDGACGIMLWRGTWHALDRFPASPPHGDFAFITGADTQRELERQLRDGTPPRLTQVIDTRERLDAEFQVVDPLGLMPTLIDRNPL